MIRKLMLGVIAILLLMTGIGCVIEEGDGSDVLVFSNPPESQRTIGTYSPSVAAQQLIDFDHYMLGVREDPKLHITYTNISNDTVQIEIGIMWLWSEERILETGYQHDVREPILSRQTETLVYRPLVESPSDIIDYCIEVHSLLTERLPHVSLGPQVGPVEAVRTPEQEELTIELSLLAVPFLSQRDGKWSSDKLGIQGPSIYSSGCALTSAAMVMAYYRVDTNPGRLNRLIEEGGYTEDYLLKWQVVAERCYTDQNDIEFVASLKGDWQVLKQELDEELAQGYPVIAWVKSSEASSHFIVFRGKAGDKYYFFDPADENVTDRIWPDGYHGKYELQGLRIYHGNH